MATVDNLWALITAVGIAVVFLVSITMWNQLTTDAMNDAIWDQSSVGNSIKNDAQTTYDSLDSYYVIIFFALHLGIIILAFQLRSHPIVYVAGIFIIVAL